MNNKIPRTDLKVLFVSCSGTIFKLIPFIKSQYDSLEPYVEKIDHYRIKGSGFKAYILAYKDLKKKLKNESFDIIHAHWSYSGLLCSFIKKKEKLVVSFMGNDLQGYYSKKYNLLTIRGLFEILLSQILLYRTDAIIVKSKKMLKWIPFYFQKKTQVIPNGVNLNRFKRIDKNDARRILEIDSGKKYILFLGNIEDANKNFQLLQKAVMRLNIEYEILKPYPVKTEQIPYYLAAADVLAFPSKLEGSPNIIKEAIAVGCPIVATDVGDVKERIGKIKGCHISKFDELDFAQKLAATLRYNKRIKANGHLIEISETNIAIKIINVYNKVVKCSEDNELQIN